MTQVTVTKNIGGHTKGDSIHTSPGAAAYLIESGHAEAVKAKPAPVKTEPKSKPEPKTTSESKVGGASSSKDG
jgi:hypothetical protein